MRDVCVFIHRFICKCVFVSVYTDVCVLVLEGVCVCVRARVYIVQKDLIMYI